MGNPCIMVVEDEFIVAQDLIASLVNMGYEVCAHTESGEKAIQLAEQKQPDLIIMDIILKGQMDGIQAAGQIHERFQIPVIFLTAFGNQALLDRAKTIEPIGYLMKPFNEGELHSVLEIGLYKAAMEKKLRLSEKRFKTMAELLPTGILEINCGHQITYMNSAGFKMLGVSEKEFETSIDIRNHLKMSAKGHDKDAVPPLMIERSPFEAELIRKDGSSIAVIAEATVMPEKVEAVAAEPPGKESSHLLVNLTDITHIKKLEFQLHQSRKMEAIGRLAGGIAHDFNNILYVILGFSELLMSQTGKDHPNYEGLKEIFSASERARLLVRQLMAFGRKQFLDINWVDINHVVRDLEKMLGRIIGEDIELKIRLIPEPAVVKADMTQIEQIIMNLAVNARDAMPEGGLLTIETAAVELDSQFTSARSELVPGNYIRIMVGDTGKGMEKDIIEKIFEPFFTTKSQELGTGLGLSTVYGIVKQHNGHIDVYSEPGRGTMFKIYFPASPEDICIVEPEEKSPLTPALEGPATVMVVEDDPSVLRMTCKILSEHGYGVLEALNAEDAVRKALNYKNQLHLLLTDVIMPGLKGPEVYKRIIEVHPKARVLFMSGYTADVITRAGLMEEGLQFIQKPFSAKDLLAKVARIINEAP